MPTPDALELAVAAAAVAATSHSHSPAVAFPSPGSALPSLAGPASPLAFLLEHPVNVHPVAVNAAGRPLHPSDQVGHWQNSALFKTMVAGVGFMSDAYDLFIMSLVIVLLSFDYHESNGDKSLIVSAVLVGSVLGQLAFGVIADYWGRKKSFVATLSLLMCGAVLSAVAFDAGSFGVFIWLALARFILGIGIGGEYPLSATVSSEASAAVKNRGRRIGAVFSMQSFGAVLAPTVVVIVLVSLGSGSVGTAWRLCLGLGAVPAALMFYSRLTMKESESFLRSHGAEANAADASAHKKRDLRAYWKQLLGTAGSWFIFDLVFYANGLFASTILEVYYQRPAASDHSAVHSYLVSLSLATLYLSLISLPGYFVATALIDVIGRRPLQLSGFAGMLVTYVVCGAAMDSLLSNQGLFYFLYGLSFFCSQGANVATFVLPAELFPTTIRATAHGISAATGKIGAAIGGALMPSILSATSLRGVMFVSAGISAVGLVWTFLFTFESMNVPLPVSEPHLTSGTHLDSMRHPATQEHTLMQPQAKPTIAALTNGSHAARVADGNDDRVTVMETDEQA